MDIMLATGIKRLSRYCCVLLGLALVACGTNYYSQGQGSTGYAPVRSGYYRVMRGDSVGRIAHTYHQSAYNIVRWNNLANPDAITVGQLLRVVPPGREDYAAVPTVSPVSTIAAPASISFIWPAPGTIERRFDGNHSKGIDIVNAAGTPVVAAADGLVVYAGHGLRGYGNMVIIKHNADYLSAYAYNRRLLVREGEEVRQGQEIAEMGHSGTDYVALHFEVRYQGRSVNPERYLPAR
jgi:murein DD-endopeptidase MepM/ murein hydrolase activator NlpD